MDFRKGYTLGGAGPCEHKGSHWKMLSRGKRRGVLESF